MSICVQYVHPVVFPWYSSFRYVKGRLVKLEVGAYIAAPNSHLEAEFFFFLFFVFLFGSIEEEQHLLDMIQRSAARLCVSMITQENHVSPNWNGPVWKTRGKTADVSPDSPWCIVLPMTLWTSTGKTSWPNLPDQPEDIILLHICKFKSSQLRMQTASSHGQSPFGTVYLMTSWTSPTRPLRLLSKITSAPSKFCSHPT